MSAVVSSVALSEMYQQQVPVGKTVAEHLYIHRLYVCKLPPPTRILVAAALRVAGEFEYDLAKVAKDGSHVCLLRYPKFDTDPHPALQYSVKVFLASKQICITDFSNHKNKPILHRKETFVGLDYPRYAEFAALSQTEEEHGLLSRRDIGYRSQWNSLLKTKNLKLRGHRLVQMQ